MGRRGKDDFVKKKRKKRNLVSARRFIFVAAIVIVLGINLVGRINDTREEATDIGFLDFFDRLESGEIVRVTIITDSDFFYAFTENDDERLKVPNPRYPEFRRDIMLTGVEVTTQSLTLRDAIFGFLMGLPLMLLLLILAFYLVYLLSSTSENFMKGVKKERAITFDKVAGLSEVKEEIRFAVDILRNKDLVKDAGLRGVKGILLHGPPGTGKTLIARAIAGEAGAAFIPCSGSDFSDKFVGVGAQKVRALYNKAVLNAPCVVFIDEADAIGRKRTYGTDVGAEFSSTLNTLLQRMDGMNTSSGVLFIAATNMMEVLDPALLRPGRFDRQVYVGAPTTKADRDAIIGVHIANKKLQDGLTIDDISKYFFGMTGAEIEGVLNEAGIESLRKGNEGVISIEDIDAATMKLMTKGTVSARFTDEERELIAIHEAGHAIVAQNLGLRLSKVSIISYGMVGGVTMLDYSEDNDVKRIKQKSELMRDIKISLGGLCAEDEFFKEHSTGSQNDLSRASELVNKMVKEYGMGSTLVTITDSANLLALQSYNEDAKKILNDAHIEVKRIILENKDDIEAMKTKLLEEEVIYF
jgi:cell division protease FtsH